MAKQASLRGGVTKEGAERRMKAAAELSDDEVRTVRREYPKVGKMVLADRYGVGPVTIMKIVRRETYRWVGEAPGDGGAERSPEIEARMAGLLGQLVSEGFVRQGLVEEPPEGAKAGPEVEFGEEEA